MGLDDSLKLWHMKTGELLDSVDLIDVAGNNDITQYGLSVCPNTNRVAVLCNKYTRLFQIHSEKLIPLDIAFDGFVKVQNHGESSLYIVDNIKSQPMSSLLLPVIFLSDSKPHLFCNNTKSTTASGL